MSEQDIKDLFDPIKYMEIMSKKYQWTDEEKDEFLRLSRCRVHEKQAVSIGLPIEENKNVVNSAELSSDSSVNGVGVVGFMSWDDYLKIPIDTSAIDNIEGITEEQKIDIKNGAKSKREFDALNRIFSSVFLNRNQAV
jgi:hypothetical protein